MREAGLTAFDLPFDHFERRGPKLVHAAGFEEELKRAMSGLPRLGRDVSFAEYLRKHRRGPSLAKARRAALEFVQGFDAADPERVSAKSLGEEMEGIGNLGEEPQFRLLDGYGALVEHLRGRLDPARVAFRLASPVSEVRWERGHVEVRCRRGARSESFRAPRVIVTVPVGVLQLPAEVPGSIRFVPDLPAMRSAASQLGSGPVVKVVMGFRETFWETPAAARAAGAGENLRDGSFFHLRGARFPTWWTARPLRVPVLTAWSGGPRALRRSPASRAAPSWTPRSTRSRRSSACGHPGSAASSCARTRTTGRRIRSREAPTAT